MTTSERRESTRVQFFLVDEVKRQLPVWVFRPENEVGAVLALAVDIGLTGIQLLIDPKLVVGPEYRSVHVLPLPEIGFEGAYLSVQFLWQRAEGGLFKRAGFGVLPCDAPVVERLLETIEGRSTSDAPIWLRCTLLTSENASG